MINIRRATEKDINTLISFRLALFKEMGRLEKEGDDRKLKESLTHYFNFNIPNNTFLAWIAEKDSKIIATSGLVFLQKPPEAGNNSGREAYLMNMFTLQEWRKKGLATKLLDEIISFVNKTGIKNIQLITTDIGESVYRKKGFTKINNYMELLLNDE
ncbi:MAG: GNAT family N-acetyltransferase [Candidatus Hodarchaeales archaeon]|jgi:GNAT superfamily N-acetyltransferase